MRAPERRTHDKPPKKTDAVQIATPRSFLSGGSVVVIVDNVAGKIKAAPIPLKALKLSLIHI